MGALVIANAVAVTLAHPDPEAIVAGADLDPVTTSVVTAFGDWSDKPFAAVVLARVRRLWGRRPERDRPDDLLHGP